MSRNSARTGGYDRIYGLMQAANTGVTEAVTVMPASTSDRSATFDSMTVFATRLAYFSCFSCSTGSPF